MTRAIIAGVADTPLGKLPGRGSMQLHLEMAQEAAMDAGLELADIDGVITLGSRADPYPRHGCAFAEAAGIIQQLRYCESKSGSGSSAASALIEAADLVAHGRCSTILVVAGENSLTGVMRDQAVANLSAFRHKQYEMPYGLLNPTGYALIAQRYQIEFGGGDEDRAKVAVIMRRNATKNPKAQFREPLTVDDVLSSPMVSSPLRKLECSPITDGGAAFIVTSRPTTRAAVEVIGAGRAYAPYDHICQLPGLRDFGIARSTKQACDQAGLKPADVDLLFVYDCYTITVFIQLEEMGFCGRGEAPGLVDDIYNGRVKYGFNTDGGLLSHGHPGPPSGMYAIIEAVRQLRGEAGERQRPGPRHAILNGNGGILSAQATVILQRG